MSDPSLPTLPPEAPAHPGMPEPGPATIPDEPLAPAPSEPLAPNPDEPTLPRDETALRAAQN